MGKGKMQANTITGFKMVIDQHLNKVWVCITSLASFTGWWI